MPQDRDPPVGVMTRTGLSLDRPITDLHDHPDLAQPLADPQTLTKRPSGLSALHAAIDANATVRGAIMGGGITADNVMAVHRR